MAGCVNGTSVKERKRITRKVTDVTLKNLLGARVKGSSGISWAYFRKFHR